jgi:hypothetical protein
MAAALLLVLETVGDALVCADTGVTVGCSLATPTTGLLLVCCDTGATVGC